MPDLQLLSKLFKKIFLFYNSDLFIFIYKYKRGLSASFFVSRERYIAIAIGRTLAFHLHKIEFLPQQLHQLLGAPRYLSEIIP